MPKFFLKRKLPSCLVSKELLSSIEKYLNVEMRQKLSTTLGEAISYQISIKEKIGTETLASMNEYSPTMFSDGTEEVSIRWDNGYRADCKLRISISFDKDYDFSELQVECDSQTARETAIGIGDAISRLLDSHRTHNWIFNPFKFPFVTLFSGPLALTLLISGSSKILNQHQQGLYILSGAVLAGWVFFSAKYFRPFISFDTRRQRLLNNVWRYFSLGTFGFLFFGTLLPLLRKAIAGF